MRVLSARKGVARQNALGAAGRAELQEGERVAVSSTILLQQSTGPADAGGAVICSSAAHSQRWPAAAHTPSAGHLLWARPGRLAAGWRHRIEGGSQRPGVAAPARVRLRLATYAARTRLCQGRHAPGAQGGARRCASRPGRSSDGARAAARPASTAGCCQLPAVLLGRRHGSGLPDWGCQSTVEAPSGAGQQGDPAMPDLRGLALLTLQGSTSSGH